MAIGHRLKFFTLINQKIREVKKGMTNVSLLPELRKIKAF